MPKIRSSFEKAFEVVALLVSLADWGSEAEFDPLGFSDTFETWPIKVCSTEENV